MTAKNYLKVLSILKKEYPKWGAPVVTLIAITTNNPFRILISTILSLRTKDQVTAAASQKLYAVADTPATIGKLPVKKIEQLIYPVGFYHTKATQIKTICNIILEKYQAKVPDTLEALLAFKGVGRKTANLVLSLGFNKSAICVDTHVHRISNRLGFVNTKTPEETEFALMEKLPKRYWRQINDLMVAFGQSVCQPIRPKCEACKINFCPSRIIKK